MKAAALFGLLGGLAVATMLVLNYGAGEIWHSIAAVRWTGFAAVVAFHLGLIVLMGLAWWMLGRDQARWPVFAWGRLIRDSGSEALPLSQIGGYVLGARAVALAGIPAAFAAGSTVVDVTVELVAQLGYTLIGLGMLQSLQPDAVILVPVLAGVGVMAVLVTVFIAVQARGAGAVEQIGARVASQLLGRSIAGSGAVRLVIAQIHGRRARLAAAAAIHLSAWVLSGVETWLTLGLMGLPVSLATGLVIDSLLYGLRSAAFMVPNAVGVQEGGLVFLCGLFGIGADAALALSLIKRGRDLVIGVPALLAWQALEGRQAWSRLVVEPETERAARP